MRVIAKSISTSDLNEAGYLESDDGMFVWPGHYITANLYQMLNDYEDIVYLALDGNKLINLSTGTLWHQMSWPMNKRPVGLIDVTSEYTLSNFPDPS